MKHTLLATALLLAPIAAFADDHAAHDHEAAAPATVSGTEVKADTTAPATHEDHADHEATAPAKPAAKK